MNNLTAEMAARMITYWPMADPTPTPTPVPTSGIVKKCPPPDALSTWFNDTVGLAWGYGDRYSRIILFGLIICSVVTIFNPKWRKALIGFITQNLFWLIGTGAVIGAIAAVLGNTC